MFSKSQIITIPAPISSALLFTGCPSPASFTQWERTSTSVRNHSVRIWKLPASSKSKVWVAEQNTQVVGASRDEDGAGGNAGEVMAIYVLATYWQTGVGLALWRAGLQYLMEQGYQRLTLWVLTGNEPAIRFYRRAGCVEETGTERNLQRGGVTLEEVRYQLPLSAIGCCSTSSKLSTL